MKKLIILLFALFLGGLTSQSAAQFAKPEKASNPEAKGVGETGAILGEAKLLKWKCGAEIRATRGACKGLVVTVPVPVNWSEQSVKILEEEISSGVRVTERKLTGGVRQMVMTIPLIPSRETVQAIRTYEITSCPQYAPDKTDGYHIPTKSEIIPAIRPYLAASPYIESTNPKIKSLAKTIGAEETTVWKQVEAVYDWVRNEIVYKNGSLKGALAALNDKTGDCEELTSLFIAICRAKGVPARTVWVPGHCYPEFYLVDESGKGVWFPCQAAGTRAFGEMPETYIILQKGDSFPDPVSPGKKVRYIPEGVTGKGGEPTANFIREKIE